MILLDNMIPAQFIRAMSWTLVHSLWQGMLVALLAGIMILATAKTASVKRYNFLLLLLFVFIAGTITTFIYQLKLEKEPDAKMEKLSTISFEKTIFTTIRDSGLPVNNEAAVSTFQVKATEFIDAHANMIFLAWFLFFLVHFIRLSSGLVYIHRLRYTRHTPVPDMWMNKLKHLCNVVEVRLPVMFLQSELVKVPVVIGMIRPVILVPVGLLCNLPVEQVEAILLHELAHIRRKDYLINLVQGFVNTVFFFNPAILWISGLIREEREACCDDTVIRLTPDKRTYLEALVSFQEYSLAGAGQALALGGHKNLLFNLISRMLTHENKKLNMMEKTVLLTSVAMLTAFSFIQQPAEKMVVSLPVKVSVPVMEVKAASPVVHPAISISPVHEKNSAVKPVPVKKVVPVVQQADTIPASVPGRIKERSEFPSISTNTNDDGKTKTSHIEATDKNGKKYRISKVNDRVTELYVDDVAVPENEIINYQPVIGQIESQRTANTVLARKRMEDVRQKQLIENERRMKERQVKRQEDQTRRILLQQKNSERMEQARSKRSLFREKLDLNARTWRGSSRNSGNEVNSIINDLVNAKLVDDRENVSFSLNNESLIVNGKKQPDEVYQQLKQKYIHKSGDQFSYSKKGNSTSITITKE